MGERERFEGPEPRPGRGPGEPAEDRSWAAYEAEFGSSGDTMRNRRPADRRSGHPSYGSDREDGMAQRSAWRRDQRQGDSGWTAQDRGYGSSGDGNGIYGEGGFPQGGYGQSGYGAGPLARRDDHDLDPDYLAWRDQQMAAYDSDYAAWRRAQLQRHDEDYRAWRDAARRSDFHERFSDWRSRRGR